MYFNRYYWNSFLGRNKKKIESFVADFLKEPQKNEWALGDKKSVIH